MLFPFSSTWTHFWHFTSNDPTSMHHWKASKGLLFFSDGAEADGLWVTTPPTHPPYRPNNSCIQMEVERGWRDSDEINWLLLEQSQQNHCSTALPHWGFVSGHVIGNVWLVSSFIKSGFPLRIVATWFQLYNEHVSKIDWSEKKNQKTSTLFI